MKYILTCRADILNAIFDIQDLLDKEGPLELTIQSTVLDRSLEQNRLMWLWYTEIGKSTGQEKEELHEAYKEKFLCNIFIRDDPGYAEMALAIRDLRETGAKHYTSLKKKVVQMTSTRPPQCSMKQMSEYLGCIHRHATVELGIKLTEPSMKGLI
jgi:hypothetical protein